MPLYHCTTVASGQKTPRFRKDLANIVIELSARVSIPTVVQALHSRLTPTTPVTSSNAQGASDDLSSLVNMMVVLHDHSRTWERRSAADRCGCIFRFQLPPFPYIFGTQVSTQSSDHAKPHWVYGTAPVFGGVTESSPRSIDSPSSSRCLQRPDQGSKGRIFHIILLDYGSFRVCRHFCRARLEEDEDAPSGYQQKGDVAKGTIRACVAWTLHPMTWLLRGGGSRSSGTCYLPVHWPRVFCA